MEISFQLTADDYRQGFKALRMRTAYSRWSWRVLYVLFVLLLVLAVFTLVFHFRGVPDAFPLWAVLAFWACILWYAPYRAANKMFKSNPALSLPRTLNASEAGLYSHSSASETRLTWEAIFGWSEVERVFAVFTSAISFFPVPKRAMTEEQQAEFRTLLRTMVTWKK